MEVMLMRGGFRGLGDLPTNDQLALLDWLQDSTSNLESTITRVRAAASTRQIPLGTAQALDQAFETLRNRIVVLTERLSGPEFEMFTGDAPIERWRADARSVIADVRTFEREVGRVFGEVQITGTKMAVIAAVTTIVLGGGVYALYRYGRRGRQRRRR